jgi:hypothetical protein
MDDVHYDHGIEESVQRITCGCTKSIVIRNMVLKLLRILIKVAHARMIFIRMDDSCRSLCLKSEFHENVTLPKGKGS